MKEKMVLIGSGLVLGAIAVALTVYGNPGNMGFCIACFLRDTAGALKLHTAEAVQYMRPEIIGLVFGGFLISLWGREFSPKSGSAPLIRFVVGFFVMIGALVFLGCPFRMILRLAGGDLNAVTGLFGFTAGILSGNFFLKRGYTLGRAYVQPVAEGAAFTILQAAFLLVFVFLPFLLAFSASGPGSIHAPFAAAIGAGIVVGALTQKSRLCMMGGIRDVFLLRDGTLLLGSLAVFAAALLSNVAVGSFNLGFEGQPIAHTDHLWNFMGMALVGYGSVFLGGCPMRQLVLAGSGNTDSGMTVLGFMAGAAFSHNFALASSVSGATVNGKAAVIVGIAVLTLMAVSRTFRKKEGG